MHLYYNNYMWPVYPSKRDNLPLIDYSIYESAHSNAHVTSFIMVQSHGEVYVA